MFLVDVAGPAGLFDFVPIVFGAIQVFGGFCTSEVVSSSRALSCTASVSLEGVFAVMFPADAIFSTSVTPCRELP